MTYATIILNPDHVSLDKVTYISKVINFILNILKVNISIKVKLL